jgi:hypothetical protein
LLACCAAPAVPSHANRPSRGLKNDLVNCPGSGIVIGADDIELDLNRHVIDGDGLLGCDDLYACDFGVDNTAGYGGVTVEDGTIRQGEPLIL